MSDKATPIGDDEFAVKLTSPISGGVGNHEAGTVLRNLSASAFNTITCGGFGKRVKSTTSGDVVDASAPVAAPTGTKAKTK